MKGVANRYSVIVGLIFLILIGLATLHTLSGGGEDTLGLDKQPTRWPLPEFAVPVATSDLEGDANIYQDDCGSSILPCSEDPPRVPACRITTPGAIRVCGIARRLRIRSSRTRRARGCARACWRACPPESGDDPSQTIQAKIQAVAQAMTLAPLALANSRSATNRSASSAAMQPVPAAVTAWR